MENKKGWLINDCLTCIPATKTFWHDLLDWFPNLYEKTNGYTDYRFLSDKIEKMLINEKPDYIIRNGSYFRKIISEVKTISLIQDILENKIEQIDVINNSEIIVFNTNYVFSKYKQFIIDLSKVRICPLGVNFDFFHPINTKHDDILTNSILYIGSSLNYPKGFNILIKIIEQMPETNFCLVMKDNFSNHNLPHSIKNRVKIFNKVNHEILRLIINSCICAVCTSLEETQHLSGIECGACNLPIIAREVGIYYDCKNDKDWGIIANDENDFPQKINYVINNKNLFNPREYFIQKYSIPICKKNWEEIINNI